MIDLLDMMDGDCDHEPDDRDEEHDGREPFAPELRGGGPIDTPSAWQGDLF